MDRDTEAIHTQEGVVIAANVWRYEQFGASGSASALRTRRVDSDERSTMIEHWIGRANAPTEWVRQPILNVMTRLDVEADPDKGALQAVCHEQAPGEGILALPATLSLTRSANSAG